MLPKVSGYDLLEYMVPSGTPVIIISAMGQVNDRVRGLKMGADDYLSKPILLDDLENMLRKHIPESRIENVTISTNNVSAAPAPQNEDDIEVFEFDPVGDTDTGADSGLSIGKAIDAGLNVEEGISFAAGDEGFYLEILRDYANDAEVKCSKLDAFLASRDWKNYNILVHSMKSASRTVGAFDLTEKARKLEEAAGKEDAGYVLANHEELVSRYRALSRRLLGR